MRESLRDAIRARYQYRCGYCGVEESEAGAELTVDHFQPRAHGGSDDPDNLVYCCSACNQFKGDCWQPNSIEQILHPLRDNLAEHIAELKNGQLQALTKRGSFHIDLLHLNRSALIANRRRKRRDVETQAEQQASLQMIQQLTSRIEHLQDQVRRSYRPEEDRE